MSIGINISIAANKSVPIELQTVPVGFSTTPPFSIYKQGNNYFADPTFDLKTHANIAVTKTYWVDSILGSDSNAGTELAPFKTLSKIQTQGDCDLCYIKEGSYFYKNQRVGSFSRSMNIIALGSGASITSDVTNQAGAWTNTTNYYSSVFGDYAASCLDWSNLDANGNPIQLTAVASIALVNTTPNSIYVAYPNVYVRTFDSRLPDANLKFYDSTALSPTRDSIKYYYENITFLRGITLANSTATGNFKAYFKNCDIGVMTVAGLDEVIMQNCKSWFAQSDNFNYDAKSGIPTVAYEINCNLQNRATTGNDQASTTHNGCTIVRVGGIYHDVAGQCCADVSGGQTWMLGCEFYNSRVANVGYYCDVNTAWLDGVYIHDISIGLQIVATRTLYYRNMRNLAITAVSNAVTYSPY